MIILRLLVLPALLAYYLTAGILLLLLASVGWLICGVANVTVTWPTIR